MQRAKLRVQQAVQCAEVSRVESVFVPCYSVCQQSCITALLAPTP